MLTTAELKNLRKGDLIRCPGWEDHLGIIMKNELPQIEVSWSNGDYHIYHASVDPVGWPGLPMWPPEPSSRTQHKKMSDLMLHTEFVTKAK